MFARPRALFSAVFAVTAAFTAVLVARPGGETGVQIIDDLTLVVAALVATAACWRAARRGPAPMRKTWLLLGAGTAAWTFGMVMWAWFQLVLHDDLPSPSAADAGFITMLPLAAAAVLWFPSAGRSLTSRLRVLADGLIVAGSILFISASTVLGAVFDNTPETGMQRFVALALPIGDVVVLTNRKSVV